MRALRSVGEGHARDALAYSARIRNDLACRDGKPSSAVVGFWRGGYVDSRWTEQAVKMHIAGFDHLDHRSRGTVLVGDEMDCLVKGRIERLADGIDRDDSVLCQRRHQGPFRGDDTGEQR